MQSVFYFVEPPLELIVYIYVERGTTIKSCPMKNVGKPLVILYRFREIPPGKSDQMR